MPAEMSAFEARRRANVANNAKLLQETNKIGAQIKKSATPAPRPAPSRKRKSAADSAPRTRTMPTRQSARIAGVDTTNESLKVDNAPVELRDREPKRVRMSGDLALSQLQVDGQRWSNSGVLASFAQGAQPGVRTFTDDDIKGEDDEKLTALRKDLDELQLYEGWQPNDIKITPERVYALTFHPASDKALVLAGDKKGVMGIFDASQETPQYPDGDDEDDEPFDVPLPKVAAYEVHTRTISAIKVPMFDQNSIITSSYDSSIRCLDIPTQVSSQLWQPADDEDELAITCIDMSAEDKDTILFSTQQGSIGRLDRRQGSKAQIWDLADNKIGGVSLNPMLPHLFATASLDRTVKIWDTRMIKGKGESQHPSLLGEHGSRLSVSHASWSRGGHLATTSYDDTIKIYDLEGATKWKPGHNLSDLEPAHSIRHNCQTGRWVTILKPQWQVRPSDGVEKFAIANMNRFVDIYDSSGKQLAQLDGEGITAVPAVAELHPTQNWVAAGTGSGKLCLWK